MSLYDVFAAAADGKLPAQDGRVEVLADECGQTAAAVVAFPAHFYVLAPVEPQWVAARLPPGDFSAPLGARSRGRGLGRGLAAAALGLLPAGTPVFAQVSPGNSISLRATLAAGYSPIGGEVLLRRPAPG